MTRFVFVGDRDGTGGIERLGRAVATVLGEDQIEDMRPGTRRVAWPARLLRDRHRLAELRPEVVVADRAFFAPYALLASALVRPRPRLVLWLNGSEVASTHQRGRKAAVLRRFDALICISRYTRQLTEANFPDPRITSRLSVINPGVDAAYWRGLAGEPVDRNSGELHVLSVGRLTTNSQHKGVDRVAAAVGKLRGAGAAIRLTVVGDGPLAAEFDEYAQRATMGAYRRHARATDGELAAHYAGADVMALPSQPTIWRDRTFIEGFGLVFLEAAACGTASIGGEMSGAADAISPGRSGELVDGSVESIVAALERILAGQATWSAESCRAWADENQWAARREAIERVFVGPSGPSA
jgi:phosphatidylinositol alpha-1,6-mannosyltransferase